jgi:HSP20 family molecular chaperone IbpA
MHATITPIRTAPRRRLPSPSVLASTHRKPTFDISEQADRVQLSVFVPGVDPTGVEIVVQGPDLVVTARKARVVRVNWQAAHLETAQKDYLLVLRLGNGLAFEHLDARLDDGILTVTVPKKIRNAEPGAGVALKRVA